MRLNLQIRYLYTRREIERDGNQRMSKNKCLSEKNAKLSLREMQFVPFSHSPLMLLSVSIFFHAHDNHIAIIYSSFFASLCLYQHFMLFAFSLWHITITFGGTTLGASSSSSVSSLPCPFIYSLCFGSLFSRFVLSVISLPLQLSPCYYTSFL